MYPVGRIANKISDPRSKVLSSADAAVVDIPSGATILIGGFGGAGVPYTLCDALLRQGARDLTVVSNHAGDFDEGLAALIREGRVRKVVCSYPRHPNSYHFLRAFEAERIEVELVPQGTLAERLRAAGAGIPAFYTPTGVDTPYEQGREVREVNGRRCLLEYALSADFALIRAHRADTFGNLVFRQTARNFNPIMATAARVTIVEADEIVPLGALDPEAVITPGVYVDRVVAVERAVPNPGVRTVDIDRVRREQQRDAGSQGLTRWQIARRVAADIPDGSVVNLGVGMPTLVSGVLPPDKFVTIHCENGVLGIGRYAAPDEVSPDLINAGREAVTLQPWGAYFHHADSFAMIRGGHIDICVLGAYQVSASGDLANWSLPGEKLGSIGGAMDLVAGVPEVWVMMTHVTRDGQPKIVERCTFPLTGARCVTRIYTDCAVIHVTPQGLVLREVAPGYSVDEIRRMTAAPLTVPGDVAVMEAPAPEETGSDG